MQAALALLQALVPLVTRLPLHKAEAVLTGASLLLRSSVDCRLLFATGLFLVILHVLAVHSTELMVLMKPKEVLFLLIARAYAGATPA